MYFFSEKGESMLGSGGCLVPTESFKNTVLALPKEQRTKPHNKEAVFSAIEKGVALPSNTNFEASSCAPVCNELAKYLNGTITIEQFAANSKKAIKDLVATLG